MHNVCVTIFKKHMTRGRQLKSEKFFRKRTRNYSEIIAPQAQSRKFDVLKRYSSFNWSSAAIWMAGIQSRGQSFLRGTLIEKITKTWTKLLVEFFSAQI